MTESDRRNLVTGLLSSLQHRPVDWRRRMSDHVAYALLVYTALQIFVTMSAFKSRDGSLLPYLALIVLVVAIIPACRGFEQRWSRLSDAEACDPDFADSFRRDRMALWIMATSLPILFTGLFRALDALLS